MSHKTYDLLLQDAHKIIDEATRQDLAIQSAEQPEKDKVQSRPIIVELYVRYIIATNKLIECYDQIVQPQKLMIIKRLLECCLGRVIELKNDLVNIDQSDFNQLDDDVLMKLMVTPADVELRVPTYFYTSREGPLSNWREALDAILREIGGLPDDEDAVEPMTEIDAIRLLQAHERARQGRLRCQFMKEIRMMKEKSKTDASADEVKFTSIMAAVRIQRMWRGYLARRNTRRRKMAEMLLIGMLPPIKRETGERERQLQVREARHKLRDQRQKEYDEALHTTKVELRKQRGDAMMEEMRDEIRTWLREYKNHSGKLPEYPTEDRGGSRLMFSRLGFSRQGTDSEMSKSTTSKESKSKKDKSKKTNDSPELKKKDIEEEIFEEGGTIFKPVPSNFLGDIISVSDQYEEIWKNKDETSNPTQEIYDDMIIAEKTVELEKELRKIVDDLMRVELQQLQAALDRDRATKGKKVKKPSKKSRRAGKKTKKKKEKDLTPDRTIESLFEELVCNGIIKKYPKIKLEEFLGEKSFVHREWGSLGDIRQMMMEYCIAPLAAEFVHENTPLMRSILIAGAEKSGKKQLVYAVCTETDSVLFDISASNIVGKYPGKSGLIMLMHLVSKVSRLLQPSVIFVEGAEKTFTRKVPKTDKSDPKRLKKDLPKLIKGIGPEDRVIVLGTSTRPWDCDQKLLIQAYQHYILLPQPSHGDMTVVWKSLLAPYKALGNFDSSQMARLSDGFTVGSINTAIKEVMTCKRMVQLRAQPLQPVELINAMSRRDPVYHEHEEALRQWMRK